MKVDFSKSKRTEIVVREMDAPRLTQDKSMSAVAVTTQSSTKETLFFFAPHDNVAVGSAVYVNDGTIDGKPFVFTDKAKSIIDAKNAPAQPPAASERTAKVKVVKSAIITNPDGTPKYNAEYKTYAFNMEVVELSTGETIKGMINSKTDQPPFPDGTETDLVIKTNGKYHSFKKVQAAFTGGAGKAFVPQPPYDAMGTIMAALTAKGFDHDVAYVTALMYLKKLKEDWK